MTSDFEGFPNTLVEAQSQGAVPIVFDTYPMARWLIEPDENGCLVPVGDVQAMSQATLALAEQPGRLNEAAGNALATARRYTEARVAGRWRDLLHGLL